MERQKPKLREHSKAKNVLKITTILALLTLLLVVVSAVTQIIASPYWIVEVDTDFTEADGDLTWVIGLGLGIPDSNVTSFTIDNMEGCGNWLFADTRYYNFNATVFRAIGDTLDTVGVFFTDGLNSVYLYYNIPDKKWIFQPEEQNPVAQLRVGSISGTTAPPTVDVGNFVSVIFPLWVTHIMQDYTYGVDVWLSLNTTAGATTGWVDIAPDYFNIYSQGGFTEYLTGGLYSGYGIGGDSFELWAGDGSWIAANQTWRNLQHYHSQFGLRMFRNDSGTWVGEDNLWQDEYHRTNVLISDDYAALAGSWKLNISMWYCDPINQTVALWVKGWTMELYMHTGDVGADDLWTNLNATFYQKDAEIKTAAIYSFIEREPIAQVRIWVDVWFNQINASSIGGARTIPFYHGMEKRNTWLGLWGDWMPLMANTTHATSFTDLLSTNNTLVHATQLKLMKIGYNLSRTTYAYNASSIDYRIMLTQFDISEFKTTKEQMTGVPTPVFVEPKVPDMSNEGFWAPLYAAVMKIGDMIVKAFAWLGQQVWAMLKQQVPWFTDFWETVARFATDTFKWLGWFVDQVVNFFNFLYQGLTFLSYPLRVIGDTFAYLVDIWNNTIGWTNPTEILSIFILIIFSVTIFEAVAVGDWNYPIRLASTAWRVTQGIINLVMLFLNTLWDLVSRVAQLIRG